MACPLRFNCNVSARRSADSLKRSRIYCATSSCRPWSGKASESQSFPPYHRKKDLRWIRISFSVYSRSSRPWHSTPAGHSL